MWHQLFKPVGMYTENYVVFAILKCVVVEIERLGDALRVGAGLEVKRRVAAKQSSDLENWGRAKKLISV